MKNVCSGCLIGLIFLFTIGCEKDTPTGLYDPEYQSQPAPVISEIIPASKALAGIVQITLKGSNFVTKPEFNQVYFNKTKAVVLQASASELVVQSPNFTSDAVVVRCGVVGSTEFSNSINYKLEEGVGEYGGYGDFDDPWVVACDKDENLFAVLGNKTVQKISPDGTRQDFGTTSFSVFSDAKFGPGGYLYIARLITTIYRIPPGGGEAQTFVKTAGRIQAFDFNLNGIMYAGGKGEKLYAITPEAVVSEIADYPNLHIKAIRVYGNHVYVAGMDRGTNLHYIWRNQIISDSELGPREEFFNWSAKIDETSETLALAISEDGDLVVGTNAVAAIVVIKQDGSFTPLYPGVLEPPAFAMSWGPGTNLYVARHSDDATKRRIIRIDMLKQSAPVFGW